MITRKDALKIVSDLNLPKVIRRLAGGETLEPRLATFWGNAEEFFLSSEKTQESIWRGRIIPLWDDGNFDKLFGVHLPTKKFVEFYVEEAIDLNSLSLWNYQQILLPTFQRIYDVFADEDEKEGERELNYHAKLFEFKYAAQLPEIGAENRENYGEFERRLEEFRRTII